MADGHSDRRRFWLIVGIVFAVLVFSFVVVPAAVDYFIGSPSSPQTIHVGSVEVGDQTVYLEGSTVSSALLYRGYRSRVADGVMVVTLNYSLLGDGVGGFDLEIPTDGHSVYTVYLEGAGERRQIYPNDSWLRE